MPGHQLDIPDAKRRNMQANRRRDTGPELALRSVLHRRGLRFRVDHPLRLASHKARPDIVFTRSRVAAFVDGCFWHGCPDRGTSPKTNVAYWIPKLEANRERDRRADSALVEAGWCVVRAWEHEDREAAASRIVAALSAAGGVNAARRN
jgi:DNA mismatch endonuclease (patch repair protein)